MDLIISQFQIIVKKRLDDEDGIRGLPVLAGVSLLADVAFNTKVLN